MRARTLALHACLAAMLVVGCDAVSRHRVLTRFFDGVPPPTTEASAAAGPATTSAIAAAARRVGSGEHGPYAARLCGACHESEASNALVASTDDLCFRCHELKVDWTFVHGAMAMGCLVCHDPHDSPFGKLLVADPDGLCLGCHEREVVSAIPGHGELKDSCITCHGAHGSDTQYLLK